MGTARRIGHGGDGRRWQTTGRVARAPHHQEGRDRHNHLGKGEGRLAPHDHTGGKVLFMTTRSSWAATWLGFALAAVIAVAAAPLAVLAQTAPQATAGGTARIAAPSEPVLLRTEPSYDAEVLVPLADGTTVDLLAGPTPGPNGTRWFTVTAAGETGFVPAGSLVATESADLAPEAPSAAPADLPPPPAPLAGEPAPGSLLATTDVNLRASPGTDADVLLVVPAGAAVTGTGAADPALGFRPVVYDGVAGWVAAEFLGAEAVPTPEAVPLPDPPALDEPAPALPETALGSATTTDALNLRAGPATTAPVQTVMPVGAPVVITGAAESGFFPVRFGEQTGWAAAAYLGAAAESVPAPDTTAPADSPDPNAATTPPEAAATDEAEAAPTPEPPGPAAAPPPAAAGGTGIAWPFSGGTWEVIQGYNNGTHTNRSAFAQYQYALDWARTDGNTAGQPVYAPVSGTIRWVDRGSGGMLIDAGNGYGVAFFHVTIDGGFGSGQQVQQGQPSSTRKRVGVISGPGGEGYASTPHLDLTLWQLTDGGHVSAPFTGPNAIAGMEFSADGSANQHMGATVTP